MVTANTNPSSVFPFSSITYIHTQGCTLRPSVSSSRLVSYPEFFWAYRCIYLIFTWVELRAPRYDRVPFQKNVYDLEYLDWLEMHFPICSKVFYKTWSRKIGLIVWVSISIQYYENMSGYDTADMVWSWTFQQYSLRNNEVNISAGNTKCYKVIN